MSFVRVFGFLATFSLTVSCFGSMEYAVPIQRIHIKSSGTLEGDVEAKMSVDGNKVASVEFIKEGVGVAVPQGAYEDLENPILSSLHFSQETGYPILYIAFLVWESKEGGERVEKRVNIAIEDGTITRRSISEMKDNARVDYVSKRLISPEEEAKLFVRDESWNDEALRGPQPIAGELSEKLRDAVEAFIDENVKDPKWWGVDAEVLKEVDLGRMVFTMYDRRSDLSEYFAFMGRQIRREGFTVTGSQEGFGFEELAGRTLATFRIELSAGYDVLDVTAGEVSYPPSDASE